MQDLGFKIAACLLGVVAASAAGQVSADERAFTERVATELRRELPTHEVIVKAPLTITIGHIQANLDRVYEICTTRQDHCSAELAAYVRTAAQIAREGDAQPTRDSLRPLVRTREQLAGVNAALPADAGRIRSYEVAPGLLVAPATDAFRVLRLLTDKDTEALGINEEEVWRLSLSNLRAVQRPLLELAKPVPKGEIGQFTGDPYHASRLALHDTWSALAHAQGGTLIVAAPTNDTILYISDSQRAAVDVLRSVARAVASGSPNRLSDQLFRWTPTGWQTVF